MKTITTYADGNGNITRVIVESDTTPKKKKVENPGRYLWASNLPPYKLQQRKEAMVKDHPEWSEEQIALFWELNS